MSYVAYVFQKHFGYPKEKANKLMLDVHQKGRAVVSNGTREEMERDVEAMHGYGLWATMQQDDVTRSRAAGGRAASSTGPQAAGSSVTVRTMPRADASCGHDASARCSSCSARRTSARAGTDPLAAVVGIGTATTAPEDPALARLFPDGYTDDAEACADFRRYTEPGLRDARRRADCRRARDPQEGVHRPAGARRRARPQAWLGVLNDLRLVLGERLGVTEDLERDARGDGAGRPAARGAGGLRLARLGAGDPRPRPDALERALDPTPAYGSVTLLGCS